MQRGMACMSMFDVMYLCMCTISWDYRLRCSWSCHDARCFFVKAVRDTMMSQLAFSEDWFGMYHQPSYAHSDDVHFSETHICTILQ